MSISPPSDIVLDTTRAADPARLAAGLRKLAEAGGSGFEQTFASTSAPIGLGALAERMRPIDPGAGRIMPGSAYQGLEAFLLQSMIGAMLPSHADQSFGKGLAGSVFKSMMAEQLGASLAKRGGIGLAKTLAARAGQISGQIS